MNIVLVNHYAGGPSFGMEFRPFYMAREWTRQGHNVLVVGASFSHLRPKQPEVRGKSKRENVDGVEYLWLKTNRYSGNGLGRILSMFMFTVRLYTRLSKYVDDLKPNLFIASSTYPLDNLPLKKLARRYNAKLCYEVHDLWPLSPMELGGYSKYHPFIVIMQWAEDFGYKHSDFVVSMLPAALPHMESRGLERKKFYYVPNGFDAEEWQSNKKVPEDHQTLINNLRARFRFLVAYAGSHGVANSLTALVNAAKYVSEDAAIVLVGDGPEKDNLVKLATERKCENVFFLPPVAKKLVPALLQSFDALFIGLKNQPLFRFGISPNKMIDYMMSGRPIIQAIKAGNNMVKEYNCGIEVEPENPMSIGNGINQLMEMTGNERDRLGENGKTEALKHHDYTVLSRDFIKAAVQ